MSSTSKKYLRFLKIALILTATCLLAPKLPGISDVVTQMQRNAQREKVLQRIQAVGGWEELLKACTILAKENPDVPFGWHRWKGNSNNLPSAIAALQPMEIKFYQAPRSVHSEDARLSIVRIKIFGVRSIVGFSKPYYGLEIITDPGEIDYKPEPTMALLEGGHTTYRKITDQIYETY